MWIVSRSLKFRSPGGLPLGVVLAIMALLALPVHASEPDFKEVRATERCVSAEKSIDAIEEGVHLLLAFPGAGRIPVTAGFESVVTVSRDDGQISASFVVKRTLEGLYIELLDSFDSQKSVERQLLLDNRQTPGDARPIVHLGGFEFEVAGVTKSEPTSVAGIGDATSGSATQSSAQCCIRCEPTVWVCCNNCCACGSCCITP